MTTALLLAAGSSRRFGPQCKLQAMYHGKPLIRYAAEAIIQAGLPAIAITADPLVAALLPEFRIVQSTGNQSRSLQAGISAMDDDAALVVLGDMPHVDAGLLKQLADITTPAATTDGVRITPPAKIPSSMFDDIRHLTEDRGALTLLRARQDLSLVHVASRMLADMDTVADFHATF